MDSSKRWFSDIFEVVEYLGSYTKGIKRAVPISNYEYRTNEYVSPSGETGVNIIEMSRVTRGKDSEQRQIVSNEFQSTLPEHTSSCISKGICNVIKYSNFKYSFLGINMQVSDTIKSRMEKVKKERLYLKTRMITFSSGRVDYIELTAPSKEYSDNSEYTAQLAAHRMLVDYLYFQGLSSKKVSEIVEIIMDREACRSNLVDVISNLEDTSNGVESIAFINGDTFGINLDEVDQYMSKEALDSIYKISRVEVKPGRNFMKAFGSIKK